MFKIMSSREHSFIVQKRKPIDKVNDDWFQWTNLKKFSSLEDAKFYYKYLIVVEDVFVWHLRIVENSEENVVVV